MKELACGDCVSALLKQNLPLTKDYPNMGKMRMYDLALTIIDGNALCEDHARDRLGVEQ